MPERRHYGDPDAYQGKFLRALERLGADRGSGNWNWDRFGAFVEFRLKGSFYRLEQTVQRSQRSKSPVHLNYGSDCFCQLVLAVEDLARLSERGIYEPSVWLEGLRALPPGPKLDPCFHELGLVQMPATLQELAAAFRLRAKDTHPDAPSGSPEAFQRVQRAYERAQQLMVEAGAPA